MSRAKKPIVTAKPKNAFDFSNDPLFDVNVESELAAPIQSHQSQHTGYFQAPNGQIVPNAPIVEKKEEVVSDEDYSEGDEVKVSSADRVLMKALIDEMTPEQANRYEVYRRSFDYIYF